MGHKESNQTNKTSDFYTVEAVIKKDADLTALICKLLWVYAVHILA